VRRPVGQVRIFGTPFFLALLSLAAAIVLWVAVTEAENPTSTTTFTSIEVRPVNIPDGLAVASIRSPTVSMRISAPQDALRRLTPADFRAEVDLAGLTQTTSEQRVIARVVGRRDAQILDVTPAVVTVELDPLASRNVPVQANRIGTPPQGFETGDFETSPAQVRIVGAQSLVNAVAVAAADVNLTGLRVTTRQQYQLVPRDARGADVRGVRVEPSAADIRVVIHQQEVTLTMTVLPRIEGSVADGYNLVSVVAEPPAVAVSGPLAILQALPTIQTERIDVSGLRSDATRQVRLNIPAGLQSTRDTITVRLRIAPAQGEIILAVPPQVTGLGDGLRATIQTSTVNLRLAGELPTLAGLQPDAMRVTVSVAGLEEGVHVLRPNVTAPEGVRVVGTDPDQVVISISR
jgi:YbbR domain-containing protein